MRVVLVFVILYVAFVTMCPGTVLTLPPVSIDFCVHGHPKALRHRPLLFSGHTSLLSMVVHTLLYMGLAYGVIAGVGRIRWAHAWAGSLVCGCTFAAFAPGLLVTVPPLPDTVCDNGIRRRHYQYFMSGRSGMVAAVIHGFAAMLVMGIVLLHVLPPPFALTK
jgi:hypothetical protein